MTIVVHIDRVFDAPLAASYAAIRNTDSYPRLFPEVVQSRSHWVTDVMASVDLIIAVGLFREQFSSRLTLTPESMIEARLTKGTLRSLAMTWNFSPAASCQTFVSARLSFDPKLRAAAPFIQRIARSRLAGIGDRFAKEAARLHQAQSLCR